MKGRKALVSSINTIEKGISTYTYDPANPVMSWGAESMLKTREAIGSLQQQKSNYREDVVSFISNPLDEDITILGRIKVHLHVSTDVEDTSFAVKVMNVMKDGTSYNIRTGITTLGYRNGAKKRIAYTPNDVVGIDIEMWEIAFTLKKGTRLRIDIQPSDFPQYAIHSNLPGIWSEHTEQKIACHRIVFSKEQLSYIELPIIESEE